MALKYKTGDLLQDTNDGPYSYDIFLITDVDPNNEKWPYGVFLFKTNKKDRLDNFIDLDRFIELLSR